tara:strand:- start:151 stop:330 length:180 start_codon:yes stop_codon:yes gene_type:complete
MSDISDKLYDIANHINNNFEYNDIYIRVKIKKDQVSSSITAKNIDGDQFCHSISYQHDR